MNPNETRAVLTLSLLAAFADGDKHERERAEIKRIAEGFAADDTLHLPSLYQDVLLKRVSLASCAAQLESADARHLAYEMAVCVCDADGVQSDAERAFLDEVRQVLALPAPAASAFVQDAEALAAAPLVSVQEVTGTDTPDTARQPVAGSVDQAALDRSILNAAVVNGALELLPESLSTMAIIPLQMKLVYGIGKAHGFELDRGHIKDFLATVGVGLTSQYLEQAGRKLMGGLLGRVGGGLLGGIGKQAVSSGMSFASTYALGHVAKQYYAGGRQLSTQMLKDAYASVTREGQQLQTQYLPAITEKARTLDASKVLEMVRA
ncbi:MAG: TerB family tellurite resistance protein [Polaromonas sp.]|nr:TerB family tellurite resistance protein [Polaromonas sp.]